MRSLARALAVLTLARTRVEEPAELHARFEAAIEKLDEADRAYLAAIERILPAARAGEMLAAIAAFRTELAELREQARAALPYGDFDPLDTFVPAFSGTHADAVRAANAADRAREHAKHVRSEANARIAGLLEAREIEQLIEAKRARQAAFDRAIRAAAPPEVSDRLATQLAVLADGWY